MATFSSDDETFEVDSILEQRKRKGILHYLVQWKEGDATWEPAERIAKDCAAAIEAFLKKQKSQSRRSSSKSRKSSRSRSRSQSRSRKGASKALRKSSRSRSRGRQTEAAVTKETSKEESFTIQTKQTSKEGDYTIQTRRSLPSRREQPKAVEEVKVEQETKSLTAAAVPSSSSSSSTTSTSLLTSPSKESNSSEMSEPQSGRTLRSSTMEARKKLEVQRVHNEQRPVREDDNKPRSAIWKIADYAVIVLFIISLIAAIFMFLEKFMDLENFKKQAFPSFETLSLRLHAAKDHLVEFFQYGWDRTSDGWDYILQQVKQPESKQTVPPK